MVVTITGLLKTSRGDDVSAWSLATAGRTPPLKPPSATGLTSKGKSILQLGVTEKHQLNGINSPFPIKTSVATLVLQDSRDQDQDILPPSLNPCPATPLSPDSNLCPSETALHSPITEPTYPIHRKTFPALIPSGLVCDSPGPYTPGSICPTPPQS